MKQDSLIQDIERIENSALDNLEMLLEFGASYYSLDEILIMYNGWKEKMEILNKQNHIFMIVAISSLLWVPLATVSLIVGLGELFLGLCIMFPLTLSVGLTGCFYYYKKYGSLKSQIAIGKYIENCIAEKKSDSRSNDDLYSSREKNI
jgi:hypothetical protein